MSVATIAVLLFGAFVGGFVSGLAGFGTGLIALGIWLYVLPPSVAGSLVIICSVVSQTAALSKLWRVIDFKLVLPFIVGGLIGVPLGTAIIPLIDPRGFKIGVGVLLLFFSTVLYFNRGPLAPRFGGRAADAAVGFAAGVLGGLAGLSGALPTLWANVRDWGKDERRGIFQTFNWTILSAALCVHIGAGLITADVLRFALFAFPATFIVHRAYREIEGSRPQLSATTRVNAVPSALQQFCKKNLTANFASQKGPRNPIKD